MATQTSPSAVLTANGILLSLVAAWFLLNQGGIKEL
jgi:hypothetical protein